MEYRGVYLGDGKEIFHFGPVYGTNNIGEFLAIVHALALLDKQGLKMTIYSDSRTAIGWVRKKCCKTQLERNETTEQLFQLIERAEAWLKSHRVTTCMGTLQDKVSLKPSLPEAGKQGYFSHQPSNSGCFERGNIQLH